MSSEKQITSAALSVDSLKLSGRPHHGGEALREQVASLHSGTVTKEQVILAHGTTGANALVLQSLLRPGDHVISLYPSYPQLLSMPRAITGIEVSLWMLDLSRQAEADVQGLEDLIRPETKMIALTNPNNPLGISLPLQAQREIVALARSRGLILLVDEIFRPLFHGDQSSVTPSFVELSESNDRIICTGSLSKAWGLTGIRAGWAVTKNPEILSHCRGWSLYTVMSLGALDETIAAEALCNRCRPQILAKHLDLIRHNLVLLESFVERYRDACSWIRPNAGATAFVRFQVNNAIVDDVSFCETLLDKTGVLLAPGSLCFGMRGNDDFRGFVRIHLSVQKDVMESALTAISGYLRSIQ